MRSVNLGGYKINSSEPVRVVAELGICHRGDLDIAKILGLIILANTDFIKFELYELDRAISEPYRKNYSFKFSTLKNGEVEENLFDLYEKSYLSYNKAKKLIKHIHKSKIPFLQQLRQLMVLSF